MFFSLTMDLNQVATVYYKFLQHVDFITYINIYSYITYMTKLGEFSAGYTFMP